MSLALFKKGDVQATAISSGYDGFGYRLAADDRGEPASRAFLSGAHLLLVVESGRPRCGELSKACEGPLGAEVRFPRLGPQGEAGGCGSEKRAPARNPHWRLGVAEAQNPIILAAGS